MTPVEPFEDVPSFMRRRVTQADLLSGGTSTSGEEPLSYPPSESSTATSAVQSAVQSGRCNIGRSRGHQQAMQTGEQDSQLSAATEAFALPPLPETIQDWLPPGASIAPDGSIRPPPPTEAEIAAAQRPPPSKRLQFVNHEVGYLLVDADEYLKIKKASEPQPWCPPGPFRFFDLPTELRIQILEHLLLVKETIDLRPQNYKYMAPRLNILRVSHRMHDEAAAVFYGRNVFRLYPTDMHFQHAKQVLIQRFPQRYRELLTTVELRLGPNWSKTPKSWNVGPKMRIGELTSARKLLVFVELDPSGSIFKGFRVSENHYTLFSCELLSQLKKQAPSLEVAEFDGFPSVKRSDQLVSNLIATATGSGMRVTFTPGGRWGGGKDLADAMSELKL